MINVSTSCYYKSESVLYVLEKYISDNIYNIELGSSHQFEPRIEKSIKRINDNYECNWTVHAYFPPLKDSFFVNIASQKKIILSKSIRFIKNMINFSKSINAKVCSFHSGFRWDPINSLKYTNQEIYSYSESYYTFLESLTEICQHAEEKNINIALEPNVVSKKNLINGTNKLLLMCKPTELSNLFDDLKEKGFTNLNLLLDLGHLKVTANTLNFSFSEFINDFSSKVIQLHIHDNNGNFDQHKQLTSDSKLIIDSIRKIQKVNNNTLINTLESTHLNMDDIKNQIMFLKSIKS